MDTPPPQSNPYATPMAESVNPIPATTMPQKLPPGEYIYSSGNVLVMHRHATLPAVCFKSNQPADLPYLHRKLAWHHPAIALLILINLLIYIVVAIAVSKRATIELPLSRQWKSIRKRRIAISLSLVGVGAVLFLGSLGFSGSRTGDNGWALFFAIGFILMLGAGIYGAFASRMVSVKKIENDYLYLKGAHPDFLKRFQPLESIHA